MIDSDIYQQRDSSLPEKLVGLQSYAQVCIQCFCFIYPKSSDNYCRPINWITRQENNNE